MKDELRVAIAAFVGASARYILMRDPNRFQAMDELHEAWNALKDAWEKHAP